MNINLSCISSPDQLINSCEPASVKAKKLSAYFKAASDEIRSLQVKLDDSLTENNNLLQQIVGQENTIELLRRKVDNIRSTETLLVSNCGQMVADFAELDLKLLKVSDEKKQAFDEIKSLKKKLCMAEAMFKREKSTRVTYMRKIEQLQDDSKIQKMLIRELESSSKSRRRQLDY